MVRPILLSLSFLFLLINGSLARSQFQHQLQQNECQFDRLQALEPDNRIRAEAGEIESWNPNHDQFRCAGVAVVRRTVERNGLHLPSYTNAPQLIYIVKGRGVLGTIFPGCAETFEESQEQGREDQGRRSRSREEQRQREEREREQREREEQGRRSRSREEQREREERREREEQSRRPRSREEQREREEERGRGRGSRSQQDSHQKIRRVREGDVIALPAGVAYWSYNDGDESLVSISLIDVGNNDNQLDQNPRRFYLAGNPEDEFQNENNNRRGSSSNGNNVFSGFNPEFLRQAFNVDEETARKLQGQNDQRKNIIRVRGQLDFVSPFSSTQERRRQEQWEQEKQREEQRRQGRGRDNGIEETFCSLRLKENIGNSSRSDIFSPNAGRISTLNSYKLPILSQLQLSAERGVLYQNGLYTPHWNLNAHSVIYALRGRARVQVVDQFGNTVFDEQVQQGRILVVPQNYAVLKKADNEGFEWIAFKTNENALINPLAGRTSVIRALPLSVLQNAFQLQREQAQRLKYNREETLLLSSSRSSSQPRVAAA